MRNSSFSVEHALYACVLAVAFALRFASLGAAPLNELEAQAAYPAHQIASGENVSLGDQAGFTLLAAATFSLASSSEFIARLWPALFGVALVVLPYFWRDTLGNKPALIFAAFLALDPGMVAVSRLASGRMIAIAGGLVALTAWRYWRLYLAAIFGVLALLASPSIFIGLIALLVTWLLFPGKARRSRTAERKIGQLVVAAAAIYLLAATLLFTVPNGLTALGGVISGFLIAWSQTSGVSPLQLMFALVAYSLPGVLFGIMGGIRSWLNSVRMGKQLSFLALFGLLLLVVHPGRQVADLLWVIVPLSALAAFELSRYFQVPAKEQAAAFGQLALVLLLGIFFFMMLAKASMNDPASDAFRAFLFAASSVLVLAAIATVLISYGWSRQAAVNGLIWGTSILFAVSLLSAGSRFAYFGTASANDLWAPGPAVGNLQLVAASLEDLSTWDQGQLRSLPVETEIESAALDWTLRNYPARSLGSEDSTAQIIITGLDDEEGLDSTAYRGQSFALFIQRAWGAWPPNVLTWLLYRQAPTFTEQAVLWAHVQLFPQQDLVRQNQSEPGSSP